jgi:hypothetical protein
MKFIKNDGGRASAGFKGEANDCVTRSFAIITGKPYKEVYDLINKVAGSPVARKGVPKKITQQVAKELGLVWVPTMKVGTGCKVHLDPAELPSGRIAVSVSKHVTAVINGTLHDTFDCTREGTRCVYGYWKLKD